MPAYRVLIEGKNFFIEMDGMTAKYGFFTIRCVTAEDVGAAEERAIQLLRNDQHVRVLVKNAPDDPPTMQVEQIEEIDAVDSGPTTGLAFYKMPPPEALVAILAPLDSVARQSQGHVLPPRTHSLTLNALVVILKLSVGVVQSE